MLQWETVLSEDFDAGAIDKSALLVRDYNLRAERHYVFLPGLLGEAQSRRVIQDVPTANDGLAESPIYHVPDTPVP